MVYLMKMELNKEFGVILMKINLNGIKLINKESLNNLVR